MRFPLFAVTALLVAAAAAPLARANTTYPAVIVYGDSLSDNGNLFKATGGLVPAPPYYNGRFSNGPVAVEQLASDLHSTLIDFAFGGATSGVGNIGDYGTQNALGVVNLPGMLTELQGSAGKVPNALIPSSLFVVWGGADDFETLLYPFLPAPTAADIAHTASTAATDIGTIVSTLELEGATNILVPNLGNLALTPEFAGNAAAASYSSQFNADLSRTLAGNSGVTLFDTNAFLNSALGDFSNTTSGCVTAGAEPACNGYLFFDDLHPTTAADSLLASAFATAVTPATVTPEPSSFLLLGTGLLGAVGAVRRRLKA